MNEDVLAWLRSCKCQQYACGHKRAADEIERLQSERDAILALYWGLADTGDALVTAIRSGDPIDAHIDTWEEARRD